MPVASFNPANPRRRHPAKKETSPQNEACIAREHALIEEARSEIRQGQIIDETEFDAWLDTLDSDEAVPAPRPRASKL